MKSLILQSKDEEKSEFGLDKQKDIGHYGIIGVLCLFRAIRGSGFTLKKG